jgi:hypothetical protein
VNESALGRVDVLYALLVRLELNTPEQVRPLVAAIHPDVEKRAIADQLIDQIVETDPDRYRVYAKIRRNYEHDPEMLGANVESLKHKEAILGAFMRQWIELEKFTSEVARAQGLDGPHFVTSRTVLDGLGLQPDMRRDLERMRLMRNKAVHGQSEVDVAELKHALRLLKHIVQILKRNNASPTGIAA